MKKKIIVLLLLVLTIFSGSFFALNINKVEAGVEAIESNEYILVGYDGYSPESYFDSLKNASIASPSKEYLNKDGQSTKEYYVINGKNGWFNTSLTSGSASVSLYNDMLKLAQTDAYYVYATAGVQQYNSKYSNRVFVEVEANGQKDSVYTEESNSNKYNVTWLKTNSLSVKNVSSVNFNFYTTTKAWNADTDFTIFEPRLHFKTVLNYLRINNEDKVLAENSVIKLDAETDISGIDGGSLLNYYNKKHNVKYEIIEGSDSAKIIGNYLYITGKSNATIKVRAYCEKSSEQDEGYLYSNVVTFTLDTNKYNVTSTSNFANTSTIYGLGEYKYNQKAYINAVANKGFTYLYAIVNGSKITSNNFEVSVTNNLTINFYFKKDIKISNVVVEDKVYDGTKNATITKVEFDGLENGDNITMSGITGNFVSENVGNRVVEFNIQSNYVFSGTNSEFYKLESITAPSSMATISKRDLTISALETTAIYGDATAEIKYTTDGLIEGDILSGKLDKTDGTNVGKYMSTIGSIQNNNYNITFIPNTYTIIQREVTIDQIISNSKTYDKNTSIDIIVSLKNVAVGDNLSASGKAEFETIFAGDNKPLHVISLSFNEDNANYKLVYNSDDTYYGTIDKKVVNVETYASSKIYGEQDPEFSYTVSLLQGDSVTGKLSRELGEDANVYAITLGSLDNPNYSFNLIVSYFTIYPKDITVTPNKTSKIYGDNDPIILYEVSGLIGNDVLNGNLGRQNGENIGSYNVLIGDLNNPNYNIQLNDQVFEITQRDVTVTFYLQDKNYDGTDKVNYTYVINNLAFEDKLQLSCQINYSSVNVANNIEVFVKDVKIVNNINYNLIFNEQKFYANILKTNVTIKANNASKTFGNSDPVLDYVPAGVVSGETLAGSLSRNEGEDVGSYAITIGSLNSQNRNYSIELVNIAYLTVLKRDILFEVENVSKTYGEADPEQFVYSLSSTTSLAFNDSLNDLTGNIVREEGENVGIHYFQKGSLQLTDNYNILVSGALTIVKRDLYITINECSKTYGDEDVDYTYYLTNLVGEDEVYLMFARESGENVGRYKIDLISTFDSRYNLICTPNYLTINKKDINLKLENKTKVYGSLDPMFNFTITSGKLVNNDKLVNIMQGNFGREEGEDVGLYSINSIGSFTLGDNYKITFSPAFLTIVKKDISVKANNIEISYLDENPQLTYSLLKGELCYDDEFEGNLVREEGLNVGTYKISQGNLSLNDNYNLSFEGGMLTINPSKITIVVGGTKQYGEEDPNLISEIVGNYSSEDNLNSNVARQSGEVVGDYKVNATFSNANYDITIVNKGFKISQRIVNIKARDYQIVYGQDKPTFEYDIVGGTLLSGDQIEGNLFVNSSINVGKYAIRSNLSLNNNYKINYENGVLTINPLTLKISVGGLTKVYGENDEEITYQITEGNLINGDILHGGIVRDYGEDAGIYDLHCNVFNSNYTIEFDNDYHYEILKKECILETKIYDKVYDGTKEAKLKNPGLVGIFPQDEVVLDYNDKTVASFVSSEPGENIEVVINLISLSGAQGKNYKITFKQYFGTITKNSLNDENVSVSVIGDNGISNSSRLIVKEVTLDNIGADISKTVIGTYDISLEGSDLSFKKEIVNIAFSLKNVSGNIYVNKVDENGELTPVDCTYKNGILSFDSTLGTFIIASDNESWLDMFTIVMLLVNIGVFAFISIYYSKKAKRLKNEAEILSVGQATDVNESIMLNLGEIKSHNEEKLNELPKKNEKNNTKAKRKTNKKSKKNNNDVNVNNAESVKENTNSIMDSSNVTDNNNKDNNNTKEDNAKEDNAK